MSDLTIIAASAKTALYEIAKQAHTLGVGLQNVAPIEKMGEPNPSALYLTLTAEQLVGVAEQLARLAETPASTPSTTNLNNYK